MGSVWYSLFPKTKNQKPETNPDGSCGPERIGGVGAGDGRDAGGGAVGAWGGGGEEGAEGGVVIYRNFKISEYKGCSVSMNNKIFASIIIPTYNRENKIKKTLISCFEQTYPFIEVIVVDDGSSDGTKEFVQSFKNKYETENKFIKYIYQDNSGACAARNVGIESSTGEYIQFLDSDDIMHPEKIEYQVSRLKNTNYPCAVCDFEYVDKDGVSYKKVLNDGDVFEYIKKFRSVFIMTPLIKKKSLFESIRWNTKLKRNQDMDFMFRYFLTIEKWIYTPGYYCEYCHHGGSQISDTYSLGIQYFELIKSFREFYKENIAIIPKKNTYLVNQYTYKIISIYFKNKIKKIIPDPVKKYLKRIM
jgi:glycosyltransferase involved in cell wall biosynthesis